MLRIRTVQPTYPKSAWIAVRVYGYGNWTSTVLLRRVRERLNAKYRKIQTRADSRIECTDGVNAVMFELEVLDRLQSDPELENEGRIEVSEEDGVNVGEGDLDGYRRGYNVETRSFLPERGLGPPLATPFEGLFAGPTGGDSFWSNSAVFPVYMPDSSPNGSWLYDHMDGAYTNGTDWV